MGSVHVFTPAACENLGSLIECHLTENKTLQQQRETDFFEHILTKNVATIL